MDTTERLIGLQQMWQIQVSSERQVRQVQNFLEANVNRPTETNVLGFL